MINLRHHSFLQDACVLLSKNLRDLLRLAGLPATRENAVRIVESLPFEPRLLREDSWIGGFCNRTLKSAHERNLAEPDTDRLREITEYVVSFAHRNHEDQDLLLAGFSSVLSQPWEAS